jgi:hypothetical protein
LPLLPALGKTPNSCPQFSLWHVGEVSDLLVSGVSDSALKIGHFGLDS